MALSYQRSDGGAGSHGAVGRAVSVRFEYS